MMKNAWEFTRASAIVFGIFAGVTLILQCLMFVTTVPPLKEFPDGGPYSTFSNGSGNISVMYWEDIARVVRYYRYPDGRETARVDTFWDFPLRQLAVSDPLFQKIQKIARRERPDDFQNQGR